jgi:predicted ferric reductase
MRLSWEGGFCVFFGTILLALMFMSIGRFDLARPTMVSVAMVGLAITMRWKLRTHRWFWITIIILVALHLPLILFIPWTTKWIPAVLIAPIGIADLYAMLWVLSVIGKFMSERETSKKRAGSR